MQPPPASLAQPPQTHPKFLRCQDATWQSREWVTGFVWKFSGATCFPRDAQGNPDWESPFSAGSVHPNPQLPGSAGSWLGGPRKTLPTLLAVCRDTL